MPRQIVFYHGTPGRIGYLCRNAADHVWQVNLLLIEMNTCGNRYYLRAGGKLGRYCRMRLLVGGGVRQLCRLGLRCGVYGQIGLASRGWGGDPYGPGLAVHG